MLYFILSLVLLYDIGLYKFRQFIHSLMITTYSHNEQVRYEPYVSIRPDKAVFRLVKSVYRKKSSVSGDVWVKVPKVKRTCKISEKPKVERKFHNFQISPNSRKNLIEKILWLNQFAKARTIRTYSGKYIYNFRTSFITLTLPSIQRHPTSEITNECFDAFLTTLRNRLKMKNYVWKLEYQDNGNVHYHLITDTYVDYFFALKHWNKIINKLGYVDEYQAKMSEMSWLDYVKEYGKGGSIPVTELARRYGKGKREKWQNPNSVDMRAVRTNNNLHYYLSKYFAKAGEKPTINEYDNEENSFGLRLCFWSRSLSKVTTVSMPEQFYNFDFFPFFETAKNVVLRVYDYCRVAYYSVSQFSDDRKRELYILFNQLKLSFGYNPAV
jgi:hypothetical protein